MIHLSSQKKRKMTRCSQGNISVNTSAKTRHETDYASSVHQEERKWSVPDYLEIFSLQQDKDVTLPRDETAVNSLNESYDYDEINDHLATSTFYGAKISIRAK